MPTPREIELALQTVEIYRRRDPVNFVRANFFQQRLYHAIRSPKTESLTVVLALKPNRVGGSFGLMNLWSAIMFGTENRNFNGSPFGKEWPFMKSARLFSTSECLADVGPLQIAMKTVFPIGRYEQNRGVGKGYNSAGTTETGWTWDSFSYGQDALSAAGANKGLILMSEPPPRPLFTEGITRLSGNGVIIVECVQMDLAPWLEELAEDANGKSVRIPLYREDSEGNRISCEDPLREGLKYGTLKLDGKAVGEVRIVRGDVEDACRDHSNGHMAHSAIEAMVAGWPIEEREARRTGKPMHLSGRIYPNWGEANELAAIPEYHAECLENGLVRFASVVDPHDRKPWACTWWACFPNEDVIAVAEWPPFAFHECKSSPVSDIESYRDVLLEVEARLGQKVDMRIIDGMFGAAIKSGRGLNIIQMLSAPCLGCEHKYGKTQAIAECQHRLTYKRAPAYDGSIRDGHILVRTHIGDNGARPKMYALAEYTPNLCRGMRRYAWKENTREDRGLSEKPQLTDKDLPDNARMLLQSGCHLWPAEPAPTTMIPRRER